MEMSNEIYKDVWGQGFCVSSKKAFFLPGSRKVFSTKVRVRKAFSLPPPKFEEGILPAGIEEGVPYQSSREEFCLLKVRRRLSPS